jgi:hypothetical protein
MTHSSQLRVDSFEVDMQAIGRHEGFKLEKKNVTFCVVILRAAQRCTGNMTVLHLRRRGEGSCCGPKYMSDYLSFFLSISERTASTCDCQCFCVFNSFSATSPKLTTKVTSQDLYAHSHSYKTTGKTQAT